MCYAAPGPRCHGHATERYEKAVAKADATRRELRKAHNELDALKEVQPHHLPKGEYHKREAAAQAVIKDAGNRINREVNESIELRDEQDATKVGIENLKKEIAYWDKIATPENIGTAKMSYDDVIGHNLLKKRLKKAENSYNASMLAYDIENGTVNGRQGSPYGSDEGLSILNKRASGYRIKAREAKDNGDLDTAKKYADKAEKVKAQIQHAMVTRNRVAEGRFDRTRASLAANKAEEKRLTTAYNRVAKTLKANSEAHRNGPQKAFYDFKRANGGKAPSRWPAAVKREHQRLEDESVANYKKNVTPYFQKSMELDTARSKVRNEISWGKKTDAEREATLRRNDAIRADYGKGPGSWTGD